VFVFVVKPYCPTDRAVSRERSLAEVYNRVPIRKDKIARYYYNFVDVNDDCVPEVLVWLFNSSLTGGGGSRRTSGGCTGAGATGARPLTCAIAPAR
jgi:hypothetical protein